MLNILNFANQRAFCFSTKFTLLGTHLFLTFAVDKARERCVCEFGPPSATTSPFKCETK